jgi:hypothetical protein
MTKYLKPLNERLVLNSPFLNDKWSKSYYEYIILKAKDFIIF